MKQFIISETNEKGTFYLMGVINIPMFGESASMTSKKAEAKVFKSEGEANKAKSIVGKNAIVIEL